MASSRQPNRPADLTGTSGEMKLVEMACLAGLSSTAGKSAGRIMHEEVRSCTCVVYEYRGKAIVYR